MSVMVPQRRAEIARAQMIELFPAGFEELEHSDGVELVAYTDAGGEERLWHAFGQTAAEEVEGGWEDRWRAFHRPVEVAGVWIGPPWCVPPDDRIAVVIEPGRAFGTGGHPTTRLAIELLVKLARGSLLDIGCGSGVVSIAAAKLGFQPVIAIDADEHAAEATTRNAEANGVSVDARCSDALTAELPPADISVANVSLGFVEDAGPRLTSRYFITSGYLLSDQPSLSGYDFRERVVHAGWAADLFERAAQ